MSNRYKVWPALPDGSRDSERILLRTGLSKDAPDFGENDIEDFFGSLVELAQLARETRGYVGRVYIRQFFPGEITTKSWIVEADDTVIEGWH
jgi:hypothetical protein